MTGEERRIILDRGFDRTVDVVLDAFLQEGFRLNPVGAGDLRRQASPRTQRYAMLDAVLPGLAADPPTALGCRVSIFELTAGCTLVTIARPAVGYSGAGCTPAACGGEGRTCRADALADRQPDGCLTQVRSSSPAMSELQTFPDERREPPASDVPFVLFDHVSLSFDDNVVLRDISFSLLTGHMAMLLGASGSGKSVILKLILGLLRPDAGEIFIKGERIDAMPEAELMRVRDDVGMLFQESALFDSLTVAENVGFKLYESRRVSETQLRQRVQEVLGFVGLGDYLDRMPSELSGGQRRRVAIARAMAARPRLLLFDEPTSGLDPITSKTVDAEIIKLRDLEHVTAIVVTHQLQDAFYVATHQAVQDDRGSFSITAADDTTAEEAEFIVLKDGLVFFEGHAAELRAAQDPYLRTYLSGWFPPLI